VTDVRAAKVDARGSTPYFATLSDGGEVFVKVLGEDERAADLLFRAYRFLRLKDVGDYRPFSSLRRTVEHEALVSLFARDAGVRTPRMQGIVEVGVDSMLLAYDSIAGESVDRMDAPDITDELMTGIWRQVSILRDRRIAHRDLRRANVFVAADHEPWLIDFGFSELAVPDDILDTDVAQLLASLVVVAGPERTVTQSRTRCLACRSTP
jgi:undecaprenyl-diphosphatase